MRRLVLSGRHGKEDTPCYRYHRPGKKYTMKEEVAPRKGKESKNGHSRVRWRVPLRVEGTIIPKKYVAKSDTFPQKSLAHHPISTFPPATRNSTVMKGDKHSSLAHKDTHTHWKGC